MGANCSGGLVPSAEDRGSKRQAKVEEKAFSHGAVMSEEKADSKEEGNAVKVTETNATTTHLTQNNENETLQNRLGHTLHGESEQTGT